MLKPWRLCLMAIFLSACHAQGCPPKTAEVFAQCKLDMQAGKATKADCERLIEASCP